MNYNTMSYEKVVKKLPKSYQKVINVIMCVIELPKSCQKVTKKL
jgi:hypothetical protein